MNVFDKHQLAIARKTLTLSDEGANIMGGMTKDEARAVIARLGGKRPAKAKPAKPQETFRTIINEGNAKVRKGSTCEKCGQEFKPGDKIICRTWRTPVMPAPAFNYYHANC